MPQQNKPPLIVAN